ncbi:dehydrogenase [Leptospira hartskeerlii]|uniref:Dehydrogenase n=1 Tax=Leptospira hartskeerlii TaxID=2023177 RepID=A0A2M9X8H5_9LEPT|nr:PQQ-dependent sugar dehydrogenase [Leptospira hartskeerlii]PJZ23996.1 dehydrogenase [Leptospira hartskeerlii]PJZ32062.1 dehydrogenase [Leptospira hartskeerlii]
MKLSFCRSFLIPAISILFFTISCDDIRRLLVANVDDMAKYKAEGKESGMVAVFNQNDEKRKKVKIGLTTIGKGFEQPVDLLMIPGPDIFLVAEKTGALKWLDPKDGSSGILLKLDGISTDSEQGLLGVVLHPEFPEKPLLYLNYVAKKNGETSRVSEWTIDLPKDPKKAKLSKERILMEVKQPYGNHNAGQLAFGKDGMLYIAWGDGGWMGDPKGNGQNPSTFLGSVLRVDVNSKDPGKEYSVPNDNPFLKDPAFKPETFAYGFRNPWRYSFDPSGRLIIADVGQDLFEEVDIVEAGKNYGWNKMEATHCFEPKIDCDKKGLTDPIYEYGREDGSSITGGYVVTNDRIGDLHGKYVFGDFVSGRIWAIDLPKDGSSVKEAYSLGKWPVLISSFGKDARGSVYIADFGAGQILRIDPSK